MICAIPPSVPKRRRLAREDWEQAALDAIAGGGLAAVAVEPLARALGVTKGSFYAHYASRDELIQATLARWELSHGAEGLAASFEHVRDPAERLRQLFTTAVAFSQSPHPSPHVSMLGELHDDRVRIVVQRVSESRIRFIVRIYRELGVPPAQARYRGRLAYAAYLGLLELSRECPEHKLHPRQLNAFVAEIHHALIRP